MDKSAHHLQAMTAAGMHAHATIFVLNANPRSGISRLFALVAEAFADRATASGIEINPLSSSALIRSAIFVQSQGRYSSFDLSALCTCLHLIQAGVHATNGAWTSKSFRSFSQACVRAKVASV